MRKTYFITGTSSGFGRLMTKRLLERGDRVVATVRKSDALAALADAHGDNLRIETLDLTDMAAIRAVVDRAFNSMGRIDVVVSNAGYGLFGAAEELDDPEIDRQIATNLRGSIQLIRVALPHLRKQGGGRIVQLSSEGGQIAYPAFGLYHATKWGVEGFVEAVAKEVAPFGIDFLLVEPGPTRTDFLTGMSRAKPMAEYDNSPVGNLRRGLGNGGFGILADAEKSVNAMIEAMDADAPPLRLALGSTAYDSISKALSTRLEAIKTQRGIATAVDADNKP
jgi:NAD(P)-dependent dehydrogenase (short-subunit alcohol dehydrogenase family)